jgi:biopolymer transport protein ExbD
MARRNDSEPEALNLVPIMNLVTILIPVLLVAIKSVELVVIDTTLPALGKPSGDPVDTTEKPPLNLSVALTSKGIRIIGDGGILTGGVEEASPEDEALFIKCEPLNDCIGPSKENSWANLTQKLSTIKQAIRDDKHDKYSDTENIILMPETNTRYEVIVRAMDACRKVDKDDLFPNVVMSGGVK